MLNLFTILLTCLIIFFCFSVIFSINAVYSILNLIGFILCISTFIIYLEAEFLAFLLIIIYVGAIAVLFLFVVMMLNFKLIEVNKNLYKNLPVVIILALILYLEFSILLQTFFKSNYDYTLSSNFSQSFVWVNEIENLNSMILFDYSTFNHQIQNISSILYLEYFSWFALITILLLFSMIGIIVITFNKSIVVKRQDLYTQINKNINNSIYLSNKKLNKKNYVNYLITSKLVK